MSGEYYWELEIIKKGACANGKRSSFFAALFIQE